MKYLSVPFLFLVLSLASFAEGDKACTYNEWTGKLVFRYQAHQPKEARGWAPTHLVLCKDADGYYAVVTHQAIGLGLLTNPPLRVPKALKDMEKGKEYAWLINESSSYDEREAVKIFDNKTMEAVVLFTGSKKQILVIRNQLGRTVSNTLFLQEEEDSKK